MSIAVYTNISALNSHRSLKNVALQQTTASERLSSGLRINKAADDAAGLAISEKMKAQIRGLKQAQRNVEDGVSLIRTMEGGMNGINEMMMRQRELTIQALNDTYTDEDRRKMQEEVNCLIEEIDTTARTTMFNEIPLLCGSYTGSTGGTGGTGGPAPGSNYSDLATAISPVTIVVYGPDHVDFVGNAMPSGESPIGSVTIGDGQTFNVNPTTTVDIIVTAPDGTSTTIPAGSSTVPTFTGAGEYQFAINNQSGNTQAFSFCSYLSVGGDVTITPPPTSGELWIQSGANEGQGLFIDLYDCQASALNIKPLLLTPWNEAQNSLTKIDLAFERVNTYRANCGAQQNRLEHISKSLAVSFTNLEDANSRISDTDMAKEMMNFTKSNVLQQASVSMLAQANQQPQMVLQLLKM